MDKLKKELQEILKRLKAFRALKAEERTDEKKAERDTDMVRAKELEAEIRELEEEAALEARMNRSINDPPPADDPSGDDPSGITVEDQPIYRGSAAAAFGLQGIDIAALEGSLHGHVVVGPSGPIDVADARSRVEQSTKRSMALIEKRQGQAPSKEFKDKSFRPIYNPELRAAGTGMIQGVGSEGGFLLQSETSIDIVTHGFNNSEVLSRCQRRTITGSESLEIIGLDETSRADGSRGGGVRVYTDAELSQIQSSVTKFEKIKLAPERLTGMYYASEKILMNAVFLGQEMRQLFAEEFAFKTQDLVIEGTGAGQALGIKNADCKISIAKETDQAATTIVSENILKMFARFYLRGGSGSVVWLANRNCFTTLYVMTHDVGTGGILSRLYAPPTTPGGTGTMLGYPVVFIEQAESLGTAGDLWLCDLSQYICVDYGDINEASSIHFKFDYGQMTFRFIYHFDGQPRLVSAITPFKGTSDTLSPFVNIAVRS